MVVTKEHVGITAFIVFVVGVITFLIVMFVREDAKANRASKACEPFAKVSTYVVDDKDYVVCRTVDGGTENKEYK